MNKESNNFNTNVSLKISSQPANKRVEVKPTWSKKSSEGKKTAPGLDRSALLLLMFLLKREDSRTEKKAQRNSLVRWEWPIMAACLTQHEQYIAVMPSDDLGDPQGRVRYFPAKKIINHLLFMEYNFPNKIISLGGNKI